MSAATDEKKFVIKHTFKDLKSSAVTRVYESPREKHYGVPWRIRITVSGYVYVYLDCLKSRDNAGWKINTTINASIPKKDDQVIVKTGKRNYSESATSNDYLHYGYIEECVIDGNLTVELEVKIDHISEIELQKLRNFDDDDAKESSDVALIVGDHKFYVFKEYLSLHSAYFKSLFSGNFSESGKSEIELKDIDPEDLQKFLEVLYGEPAVDGNSVYGILQLADMYDSKTAIQRCQEFLIKSSQTFREKFHTAIKYSMEELKKKCLSEMKTRKDYRSILPENADQFDAETWEELFLKGLTCSE